MTAKEIVVGVDDSLAARAALRWTAECRIDRRGPSRHPRRRFLQFAQGHAARIMVGESESAALLMHGT
jgi:hypothetical protein